MTYTSKCKTTAEFYYNEYPVGGYDPHNPVKSGHLLKDPDTGIYTSCWLVQFKITCGDNKCKPFLCEPVNAFVEYKVCGTGVTSDAAVVDAHAKAGVLAKRLSNFAGNSKENDTFCKCNLNKLETDKVTSNHSILKTTQRGESFRKIINWMRDQDILQARNKGDVYVDAAGSVFQCVKRKNGDYRARNMGSDPSKYIPNTAQYDNFTDCDYCCHPKSGPRKKCKGAPKPR